MNALGRLTQISDPTGTTQYAYDPHGNVTEKRQTIANRAFTVGYRYQAGRLSQIDYPSGATIEYHYAHGRPSAITVNQTPLMTNIRHEPFGLPNSWIWGNGKTHERTYDQNGRLKSLNLPNIPPTHNRFAYDALNRIVEAEAIHAGEQRNYRYDATGNRTEFTENETTQQYQIDPQSNRLLKVEGTSNLVTYQYDETGSLTRRNADTFIYDQRGRLVQANGTTYKIDALNLRVEKQGQGAATSSGIRQFVYDEQGHLIGEYDAATGNPIIEHVWLNDLPVAVIKNSSVFYVYPDHLGTPRAITDDQNRTVWYWNYDEPFGKTEPNEDPNGLGDFTYNLRFPGQYYDAETRLHYNWHRDYDASTGRYIQSDPIGLEGGINIYAYVEGNPIMFTDPWGLFTITVDDSGGRNGSTYGGTMTVVGNNGQTVTVPVSTWPNPTNPSPGIQPGAYPGTYSPTGHRGRTNGVRVNDGNAIPTLGPNPAQNNQPFADGINIHCGDTQTNRGSSGCITIDPNYCQQVWNALQPGETGPVQVNRP